MNVYLFFKCYFLGSDDIIKEWLVFNICRCIGYKEIEDVVKFVLYFLECE